MTQGEGAVLREHSNSYNIFILVLTVLSLAVMVLLFLPLGQATHDVLLFYDNLICVVFLGDFLYNLTGSTPKRAYFIHGRGWLDLLAPSASFGILRFTAIFRLARLSRLARIMKMLGGKQKAALIKDVVQNRGQYATFVTLLLMMLVLTISSVLIVQFEAGAPDGNIKTGGDALWWAFTTITTVGYGDRFPVTLLGRTTAVAVMFAGIGVIGALASILASLLVSPTPKDEEAEAAAQAAADDADAMIKADLAQTRAELAATRAEMAELRRLLSTGGTGGPGGTAPPGGTGTSGG